MSAGAVVLQWDIVCSSELPWARRINSDWNRDSAALVAEMQILLGIHSGVIRESCRNVKK